MYLNPPQHLQHIAQLLGAEFAGDPHHLVSGLNEIHKVEPGDLVFVDHPKYYDKALTSKATTILINKKVPCPAGKGLIFSEDPFRDYNILVKHFHPIEYSLKPVSDSAVIGLNTIIMPGVYVGRHVKIGENCIIHPNTVIYDNCEIGNNVIIHAGTVIGADAFYYKKRENKFDKMISCGRVVIKDEVEIGSQCSIDKGVSGDTIIGKGTKIDDHVHIGHDTEVGELCLFAAQVGIAGAVKIGNKVTLWGQVGVSSGIEIGDGAVVLAQSGVGKSVEPGKTVFGTPAADSREKMRELNYIKRIPEIISRMASHE